MLWRKHLRPLVTPIRHRQAAYDGDIYIYIYISIMFDQPKQDSFAEIFLGNEYASYSDENLCRSGEMGTLQL